MAPAKQKKMAVEGLRNNLTTTVTDRKTII